MDAPILSVVIPAGTALAAAALTYVFGKLRDREAEWRKLKLDHYKEYVAALSGVIGQRATDASQTRYSDAANFMTLVAPPDVMRAFYSFQDEIGSSNQNRSKQRYDDALTALFRAVRRDVHPKTPDDTGIVFRLFDVPPPSG
jgi:hypothetical protein